MLDTIDSNQTWEQLKLDKINFKLELKIITHDDVTEHPFVNISLNGFPQFGEICKRDTVVEFDVEIEDDTENFLTIEYNNKIARHDVVLGEDGVPVLDKRVEIIGMYIDDVKLDTNALVNPDAITFTPIDPEGNTATGFDATKLAWNGKTTLRFTTPVYIWLLENL